jgi:alpha-glucosidase
VFGGVAWTWEPRRRQYYFHNFLKEQPDLNFHEPQVQDAALAVARFWLDRGVDGFRLDVANLYCHDRGLRDNPPSHYAAAERAHQMQRAIFNRTQPETLAFVARLRALLDQYGERMSVAEIAAEDQIGTMIEYTDGPDRYHTAYTFVFLRDEFGAAFIRARVEEFFARSRTAWPTWAFSNHDVQRVVSRWGRGAADAGALAKCLIALLTSLKGSICLYQGEELGLPQAEVPFERLVDPEDRAFWPRAKRDGARTPMPWVAEAPFAGFSRCEPWLPVDPRHPPLAVDRQEADGASTLAFTRSWLAFRRAQPSLKWGDIAFLDAPEPLLVFTRSQQVDQGTDRLVLAFNLSPQSVDCHLELDGRLAPLALPQRLGGSVVTGERRMISLPGWGVAICRVLGT